MVVLLPHRLVHAACPRGGSSRQLAGERAWYDECSTIVATMASELRMRTRACAVAGVGMIVVVGCAAQPRPRLGKAPSESCALGDDCVSVLDDAVTRLSAEDRIAGAGEIERSETTDLDGDGHPEIVVDVPAERGATGNATYLLYVGGPACRRYAGEIFAMSLRRLRGEHCGARDLEAYSGSGCAGLAGRGRVLVFDGARYREDASESFACECPIDAPDAARDRRCPRPG